MFSKLPGTEQAQYKCYFIHSLRKLIGIEENSFLREHEFQRKRRKKSGRKSKRKGMEGKERWKEEWKAGKEGEKEGRMERRKREHRDRLT